MNLSIDQCGRHGYYAISINDEDCGTRLTPSKCCGSWQTVKTWAMTADQLRRMAKELTAAADSISTPPAQQPGEVAVTDEMVERAANARLDYFSRLHEDALDNPTVEMSRASMRAALTAALAPKEKGNG